MPGQGTGGKRSLVCPVLVGIQPLLERLWGGAGKLMTDPVGVTCLQGIQRHPFLWKTGSRRSYCHSTTCPQIISRSGERSCRGKSGIRRIAARNKSARGKSLLNLVPVI